MRKKILLAVLVVLLAGAGYIYWQTRPDVARLSNAELTGRVPVLSSPRPQAFPTVNIAPAVGWSGNDAPVAAPGLSVVAFASGLDHPRNLLVLPNGDVLVAESNSPPRAGGGITGWFARRILGEAGAAVPSANRITLLRDGDGDGVAEVKRPIITGLNSPSGMALVGSTLYIANTDALVAYDFDIATGSVRGAARKILDLPARGPNNHWAKSMVASADGNILYIAIGSNSNIGEGGMAWERGRARILEVRPGQNYHRSYAEGLRNPSGLAIDPDTGHLWANVNERDMLGSDMVPDYLTEVSLGDFYGWPWYYWGGFVDDRVKEQDYDDRRQYVVRPDYALGAHVAPLGMSFANGANLGPSFSKGMFVALHGSWNRAPRAGYKVVFVPFSAEGEPLDALPIDILTGFVNGAGQAMGRPADAKVARDGALLIADDVGNRIWRVSRAATRQSSF